MTNSTLIKNAHIINYNDDFFSDVLIINGKIIKIDNNISEKTDEIIDISGKFLIPGGIDPHVHMNLPTPAGYSSDNFISGSNAAIKGGTTTLIDFVTPHRGQSLVEAYKERLKETEGAKTNVFFHVSPVEWRSSTADEMRELALNYNINSFKIYLAYKSGIGINDDVIIKVLETAKKLNVLVTAHCENEEIINYLRDKFLSENNTSPKFHPLSRPAEAEVEAVRKMILFSKYIDTPIYIVHVSSGESIKLINEAQKQGVKVFAETCPHYLLLNDSVYDDSFENAAKYVLSPPIRKKEDNLLLWEHIQNNTVQTIGTDHCPFNLKGQKDLGKDNFTKIANGAGSVENRLLLLYTYGVKTGKISMQKFVEICSYNPAKIFKLKNKGEIKEGFDADLVVFNPDFESEISAKTQYQNCDNSIYEGFKTFGKIEEVFIKGKQMS